uniref:RING-type domain-containing protein n=1 Tax=Panagrolaimus superbus TaxID=310955 RepID=A0A914Z5S4_9BILA
MACMWIHCNICMRLPTPTSRFYISNCSHVVCDRCVEKKLIVPICTICKRGAKIEEINKDLKEDLKKYFINIHDFAVKTLNEIKTIIDFQTKNCRRLMRHKMQKIQELQSITARGAEMNATIAKLEQQVEELKVRNDILRSENQNLNTSCLNQQTMLNNILSGSVSSTLNLTPSFLHGSVNNLGTQDLFNLVNASYLNASLAPKRGEPLGPLQESILTPNQLALDQSSLNFGQSSSLASLLERIAAQNAKKPAIAGLPLSVPQTQHFSTLRPEQRISATPSSSDILSQKKSESARPFQLLPDTASTTSRRQIDKLNHSSRSLDTSRTRSDNSAVTSHARTRYRSRSANSSSSIRSSSKSTLYKAPLVTLKPFKTPQLPSQGSRLRSRTVCQHWPMSQCRCNK